MADSIILPAIKMGHSYEFLFELFEDEQCTIPKAYPSNMRAAFASDPRGDNILMTFVPGAGMTVSGNQMRIKCSKGSNNLPEGQVFFDVRVDPDAEQSYIIHAGTSWVENTIA